MRANGDRGDWLGDRANEVLRFWDNNPSAVMTETTPTCGLTASTVQHEDTGSEALYIANGLITQGLEKTDCHPPEDSLPPLTCSNRRTT